MSNQQLTANDIVIALMGVTGSGKTSFIQQFCQQNLVIGHGLESCTAKVDIVPCIMPNKKKIYLIDTPGFDDTHRSDTAILGEIADWLAESYSHDVKLSGIIYLHRITDTRVGGAGMKNLRMFRKLCGAANLGSVVLATTMWSDCKSADGERREAQLKCDDNLWQPLFKKGAQLWRHDSGEESGQKILDFLINKSKKKIALDIQVEMVDQGKELSETGAGQEVQAELERLKREHDKEMLEYKREMEEAILEKDAERQEELRNFKRQLDSQQRLAEQETKRLERSRKELRKEMKDEHRREVAELRAEASRRERELEATSRQNTQRHEQMQRELTKMNEKMKDSKIKDKELAALRAEASRKEGELQVASRQNNELQERMLTELADMKHQIGRSKMKEGFHYKHKYTCPGCNNDYLFNKSQTVLKCNTARCEQTHDLSGSRSRSNSFSTLNYNNALTTPPPGSPYRTPSISSTGTWDGRPGSTRWYDENGIE